MVSFTSRLGCCPRQLKSRDEAPCPLLGQRHQPSAKGYLVLPGWSPSSPDLYGCPRSRETPAHPALSPRDEGTHAPRGQRRQLSATGRGTTLSCLAGALHLPTCTAVPGVATSLKSGDDGTQAPRGQRHPCVGDVRGLVCPSSGSATPAVSDGTGGQASYSFCQSCYRNPLGQHGEGSATVIMSRPWFLIFARLPGQRHGDPQALLTSLVARSLPTCHPEVGVCKVWFESAATVRTRLSDLNASCRSNQGSSR